MIVAAAIAAALQSEQFAPLVADAACERAFYAALARMTGHDLVDVTSPYEMLSPNLHHQVHSPHGWSALACIMVADPSIKSPVVMRTFTTEPR